MDKDTQRLPLAVSDWNESVAKVVDDRASEPFDTCYRDG